jgi:hypothetical protein
MKCPACEAAGDKSVVTLHSDAQPPRPQLTFYDEDGDCHLHGSPSIYPWSCSRGHRGTATTIPACPSSHKGCGANGGLEIKVIT